ncbi:ABC transporter substrate-binding protein [Barrientosiimonas marina]|uniref:ABC transporter substrate-binding protein n=1 Tax=Lentibacillus kimchii TaxID=1542911 RepID=A0ABW2UVS1_9BACI
MKKNLAFTLLVMVMMGLLISCSAGDSTADEGTENADEDATQTDAGDSDFPLTVTDALDNEMTIEAKPERIVSLIPSNTEIAFALGLEDEIVGVTDNDDYPQEAQEKEKVGGMELNVEKIISLKPDLVLAHASAEQNFKEALKQIRDADINVFVVQGAQQIDETYDTINQIGEITGTQETAEDIVSNMQEEFASLIDKTDSISDDERKSVFFEVAPAPDMFTAGENTFFNDLLRVVNADNVSKDQDGWTQIDPEAVVELDPDVIITTYGTDNDPVEQVTNRDGWEDMTAIKNDQVYQIDSDIVSRPGPRLVDGAKEIAKVVYPELFKE